MKLSNTTLASYTSCNDGTNSPCPGTLINGDTKTMRYTLNITWDGLTASIGSNNKSSIGDQLYQCFLDNVGDGSDRIRTLTIKGNEVIVYM